MHCSNCGKSVSVSAVVCPSCGVPPRKEHKYCHNCGESVQSNQVICVHCGVGLVVQSSKSKTTAGLLGIFLGALGIHKFYLNYNTEGIIMLLVSVLTLGFGAIVMEIIGLIEGIIYLSKSDEDFDMTYVANKKKWF